MQAPVRSHGWCFPSLMLRPAPVEIRGERSSSGCCPSFGTGPRGVLRVGRVQTGDLYDLVGTDLNGRLPKHIYASDLGPNVPS